MKVIVSIRPNARIEKVEQVSDAEYRVWVKAPAREGKANEALIEILSKYFDRPKQAIILCKGTSSRKKVVEIR
jgi:uncharacterized protein